MPVEIFIVPVVFGVPASVIALRMWLKHREKMAALGVGSAPSQESDARLKRVESAVESMSVELERIGEGQRFLTKLLSDRSQSADSSQRIGAGK